MQQNTPERDRPEANIPNLSQAAPIGGAYTNDEWKVLLDTPVTICRAVMAVSPSGAVGTSQEVMAMRNSLKDVLQKASNPLLQTVRQQLQSQENAEAIWRDVQNSFKDRWDAANVRQTAIAACQRCVSLLKKSSAQDAQSYKEFLYAVARKVAEAAKEGGFMGVGGKAISEAEQSLLSDISNTLGIPRA